MLRRFSELSLSAKLFFLVLPLAFPLILLLWLYVSEKQIAIDFAERELSGLNLLDPLVRGAAKNAAGQSAPVKLPAEEAELLDLKSRASAVSFTDREFLDLASLIGDQSYLILDPDVDTYYLMDVALLRIPPHIAALAEMARTEDKNRLEVQRILALERLTSIRVSLAKIEKENPRVREPARAFERFEKASLSFLDDASVKGAEPAARAASEFYDVVSRELRGLLRKRADAFALKRNQALIAVGLLFLVAILAVLITARSIRRPIEEIVGRVEELSRGGGDLTLRLSESRGIESRRLAAGVNAFVDHLSQTISQIRTNSAQVSGAAAKLSTAAGVLADSITNQASASEEAAAAMEQITASFDSIALSTEQTASEILSIQKLIGVVDDSSGRASKSLAGLVSLSNEAAGQSRTGQEVVEKTRTAMHLIRSSSEQISGILAIINSVSDQIDLLALNASIEAARAGDAGRGFAVVAQQIGRLAGSTADGVEQIQALLQQSQQAVAEGSEHVDAAIPVLGQVFSGVGAIDAAAVSILKEIRAQSSSVSSIHEKLKQIAGMAEMIESAVREQRNAGREVLGSIESMSREIQSLAQNGDDVAGVGTQMKTRAVTLDGLVSGFKTE